MMTRTLQPRVRARALAVALCLSFAPAASAALPGGTLDPTTVPKFATPLVIPPVMPAKEVRRDAATGKPVVYYEIEVTQFRQQILPSSDDLGNPTGLPPTTVWSYGAVGHPETRNYPAFTIENVVGVPTRVKWVNSLVDEHGNYLPHLLPVDQTIHWANPGQLPCAGGMSMAGGGMAHTDCRPASPPQTPYTGPVPIVTHVHGAHVQPDSDGYPEAWYLPAARDIPAGYATHGTRFDQIRGARREAGAATFQYRNDQPSTTLWYHDHALGLTRANVYAGPAGFYLLRDPADLRLDLPGPAPLPGFDPNGNAAVRRLVHEIPIVIQDRSFNADGSLFYPGDRDFFEGLPYGTLASLGVEFTGSTATGGEPSDIAPIWNPEFFGNTIVVNGSAWPRLDVEQRKYRLRFLNGSDARFLMLRFAGGAVTFQQIGGDQGFLPRPVSRTRLLLAPAERADVIVDFSAVPAGTRLVLENIGPDEPFGGGEPCVDGETECDFEPADPATTGVVMAFDVTRRAGPDLARVPKELPSERPLPRPSVTRRVSLNEQMSMNQVLCLDEADVAQARLSDGSCPPGTHAEMYGPAAAKLGTVDGRGPGGVGSGVAQAWMDAVTENPALGATETWELYNFTADAHPIHLHLVRFQVVDRELLQTDADGVALQPAIRTGIEKEREPWEAGYKDTVIAYPGQVTRVKARFDIPGLYVWHCHILEHEDNEMMRPYCVGGQDTCPLPIAPGAGVELAREREPEDH